MFFAVTIREADIDATHITRPDVNVVDNPRLKWNSCITPTHDRSISRLGSLNRMPAKNSRVSVYRADRAAEKLGISLRHLRRITREMQKNKSRMGSNLMYFYSDADLDAIRARKSA